MKNEFGFIRRANPDSGINSICLRCFRVIATETKEIDFLLAEENHTCSPEDKFARERSDSQAETFWKS
jgi:hypothetical protein